MAGASVAQTRGQRRREAVEDGVRGGSARGVVHVLAIAACTKQMTARCDIFFAAELHVLEYQFN